MLHGESTNAEAAIGSLEDEAEKRKEELEAAKRLLDEKEAFICRLGNNWCVEHAKGPF